MLTPMDIHNHQFKKSIRGYNENEVDDFLDKIVVDYEKILRENERLRNLVESQEKEVDHYRKLEKTMNDTLMVAQKTADEVISSAKKNSDELKENTARECQNIRSQAQLEAQQLVESASKKRDAIFADYSKLVSDKNSFLLKMRMALESELAITNQMISAIPKVEISAEKSEPEENLPLVETAPEVEETPAEEEIISADEVEKKIVADEETKIYTFVKKSPAPDEEAAK